MTIEVTLDVYSGRPNPQWVLSDDQEREFLELLQKIETRTLLKPATVLSRPGYRGFKLKKHGRFPQGGNKIIVHEGIIDLGQHRENRVADDRDLEMYLLKTAPDTLSQNIRTRIISRLNNPRVNTDAFLANAAVENNGCPTCEAADAPQYDPSMWSSPSVQDCNNCYNYANNQITNNYAQPGHASGLPQPDDDCQSVQQAALADGLVVTANFTTALTAGEGWYVALVIDPGEDYHWYRQDADGCWSHKMGEDPVTALDADGKLITDPKTCARGDYTVFCAYMITKAGITISGPEDDCA